MEKSKVWQQQQCPDVCLYPYLSTTDLHDVHFIKFAHISCPVPPSRRQTESSLAPPKQNALVALVLFFWICCFSYELTSYQALLAAQTYTAPAEYFVNF